MATSSDDSLCSVDTFLTTIVSGPTPPVLADATRLGSVALAAALAAALVVATSPAVFLDAVLCVDGAVLVDSEAAFDAGGLGGSVQAGRSTGCSGARRIEERTCAKPRSQNPEMLLTMRAPL